MLASAGSRFCGAAARPRWVSGRTPTRPAACGGSDDGGGGEAPPASGTVDYLSWEGYDIPDQLKAWLKDNSVKLKPTYIGNHDDIQAKLKASDGSEGFDLITYYQGYKPLYAELEILGRSTTTRSRTSRA